MNIKQFLVIKACDNLPSDVRDLIWKQVEISAANTIRNVYLLKVSRNVDVFLKILNFSNNNNSYYHRHISNYFKYNNNKITYKYIELAIILPKYFFISFVSFYKQEGSYYAYPPS